MPVQLSLAQTYFRFEIPSLAISDGTEPPGQSSQVIEPEEIKWLPSL
jgi:hypothetical protein